jgi:hypothetical protein
MTPENCWIRYQLVLQCVKLKDAARKANCSVSMVSQVIAGIKNSETAGLALAKTFGFAGYKDLRDAAYQQSKGGAA